MSNEDALPPNEGLHTRPKTIRQRVTAHNDATMRTVIFTTSNQSFAIDEPQNRGGNGTAPSPLETVIGALLGCSAVTFERAAKEQELNYEAIDFDAEFELDRRGLLGLAPVRPYFSKVIVKAHVDTSASPEMLQKVVSITEERCPVRNLLVDAGVELTIDWKPIQP